MRESDTTALSGVEQLVHKFIDMDDREARVSELPELSVIVVKRLKIAVDVLGRAHEAHVKGTEHSDITIVFVPDELGDDLHLGLDLEHGEQEADKVSGLVCSPDATTKAPEFHGPVHQGLCVESKTLFLPVQRPVDPVPHDLLHQVGR